MSEGRKSDNGKAKLSLVNRDCLNGIAKAMEYGMHKYEKNNYKKGMDWSRIIDALLRHANAWADGEELDKDPDCEGCKTEFCKNHSGLNHMYHVGACANMLLYYIANNVGKDDR